VNQKLALIFAKDKDIITGNIPRNILPIALPLMIGALLQTTQNLIDIFWVGKLGPYAITAVAMGSTVLMFVFTVSLGLGIATLSLVAKNIGQQNIDEARLVASHSMALGILLGLVTAAIGFFFSERFLFWLRADSHVAEIGTNYLRILLMGSITMIVLFIGNYTLQGAGDVINPMIFLGLANVCNMILDPIFIFGLGVPRMGVAGAALATILGQAIAMIMVLRLLNKKETKINVIYPYLKMRVDIIKNILKIGIPSSLQMFFRTIMYVTIISLVAIFGLWPRLEL
jgi:putative MATE family efflux protein